MLTSIITGIFANGEHIVVAGETLYAIARQHQVSVSDLQAANNAIDPSALRVGMTLKIPTSTATSPTSHIVQAGETYYSIARQYSLNVSELLIINQRNESTLLKVGEVLVLTRQQTVIDNAPSQPVPPPPLPPHWPNAGSAGRLEPTLPSDNAVIINENSESTPQATSTPPVTKQTVAWPINGQISQYTGKQGGVTISSTQDAAVRSVASGTVIYLGPYRELGNIVLIEKSGGYIYIYGGLDAVFVTLKQEVNVGTALGMINSSNEGMVFSVFKDANPINPETAPRD